ncbi:MAG: hypothetical protein RI935_20 [Candidatus Parcubacteria bacterium]|jgi:hypothetical protein
MQEIQFNTQQATWSGTCSRCGKDSYFEVRSSFTPRNGISIETLYCPGGHVIVAEYTNGINGTRNLKSVFPKEYVGTIPSWLPDNYKDTYMELLKAKSASLNRSVVALCGVLLEAHVNSLIKNPGEKKLSLFKRLELLYEKNIIDKDQFSNGTITRITRNEVLHPEEILEEITESDVNSIFEEVTGFFERSFRWRSSKALGSPKEVIEDSV